MKTSIIFNAEKSKSKFSFSSPVERIATWQTPDGEDLNQYFSFRYTMNRVFMRKTMFNNVYGWFIPYEVCIDVDLVAGSLFVGAVPSDILAQGYSSVQGRSSSDIDKGYSFVKGTRHFLFDVSPFEVVNHHQWYGATPVTQLGFGEGLRTFDPIPVWEFAAVDTRSGSRILAGDTVSSRNYTYLLCNRINKFVDRFRLLLTPYELDCRAAFNKKWWDARTVKRDTDDDEYGEIVDRVNDVINRRHEMDMEDTVFYYKKDRRGIKNP